MNTVRKKRQVAGSTLKRKRRQLNLSRAEVAKLLCISESTYRLWEINGAGEGAVPFATGQWDNVIRILEETNPGPFLECIGHIYSDLTENNQLEITTQLDQLSSAILSKLIFYLKV